MSAAARRPDPMEAPRAPDPVEAPRASPDPMEALRAFVDRVAPFDPDPAAPPVGTVEISAGRSTGGDVVLSPYVAAALVRALAGYRDPADRGSCADCGGRRLDENLHCPDCGRLHGVLGEVIARRAAQARTEAAAGPGEWPG